MITELKTGHQLLSELETTINEWIKEAESLQKKALEYSRIIAELKQESYNYVESMKGLVDPLTNLYPDITTIIETTIWENTEAGFYEWSEFHTKMLTLENMKPCELAEKSK